MCSCCCCHETASSKCAHVSTCSAFWHCPARTLPRCRNACVPAGAVWPSHSPTLLPPLLSRRGPASRRPTPAASCLLCASPCCCGRPALLDLPCEPPCCVRHVPLPAAACSVLQSPGNSTQPVRWRWSGSCRTWHSAGPRPCKHMSSGWLAGGVREAGRGVVVVIRQPLLHRARSMRQLQLGVPRVLHSCCRALEHLLFPDARKQAVARSPPGCLLTFACQAPHSNCPPPHFNKALLASSLTALTQAGAAAGGGGSTQQAGSRGRCTPQAAPAAAARAAAG